MAEVTGFDHIYITVSDLTLSQKYYDSLMPILGFKKSVFHIDDETHINYYNRFFGLVLRPARSNVSHNPYAPGLHHACLRVNDIAEVNEIYAALQDCGISASSPCFFKEYAPDYYAIFLSDPDGIKLEITNYRQERRERHDHWTK